MAFFPDSLRKVFIGAGPIRTTGSTANLKGGELGLFDAETYNALAVGATYTSNPKVILAQGSFHTKDTLALGHGGLKESIKSRPISGANITEWRLATPSRPQSHIIAIGYDGVDTSKTIAVELDTAYRLRITVKGSPVSRFINHDIYHDFFYKTECGDDCEDNCADPTTCNAIVEDYVKQINAHPFINPFVKAEAIYNCGTPANPTSVEFDLYQLSVCDTGDAFALAEVQRQYPDVDVERVSRSGSISVYEICTITSDGAPDDFSNAALTVVPSCGECPTGYTAVGTLYKIEIKRDDAGSAGNLTTVDSDYTGESAGLTVRVSYEFGTSTYIMYFPTEALRDAAVATPVGNDLVISAGTVSDVCTLDSETTTAWVDVDDRYKTTRTLTLTLAKDCGGNNRLDELIAFYADDNTLVSAITVLTSGDCADIYTVDQYNDECLVDPCASHDNPTFSTVQSFEGSVWDAEDPELTGSDCSCGIRLSSAYIETKFGECSFDPFDHYELEIPKIYVSQVNESGDPCDLNWPVTELQNPKFARGTGEWVKRELIQFMRYKQEPFWAPQGSRMNETQDINSWLSAVDTTKYYKAYFLVHNVPYTNRRTNLFDNEEYELMVVFPEEADTSDFENLINGYVTSVGIQLKAV